MKTKRKPADACGRRRLEDPAGRKPEEAGKLLHGRPAGLKRSFLHVSTTDFHTVLFSRKPLKKRNSLLHSPVTLDIIFLCVEVISTDLLCFERFRAEGVE
jgi:hypothetical protein